MKSSNLLFSAIHLIVTLFVMAVGVTLIILPYAPHFRWAVREFLTNNPTPMLSIGIPVFLSGILLLLGFYHMHKRRYLKINMGCTKAFIEEEIIRSYVRKYWEGLFPGEKFDLDIAIGKNQKIEVITRLPGPESETDEVLTRIKNELGVLLARHLGYEKEFTLTITE